MFAFSKTLTKFVLAILILLSQVESSTHAASTSPALGTLDVALDFLVPSEATLSELAVVGTNEVFINAGAQIVTPYNKFSAVASLGPNSLKIEHGAEMGTVLSVGSIRPAEGVHIHGKAITSNTINAPAVKDYIVDDGIFEHQHIPTRHLVRRASFSTSYGTVVVSSGQAASITPGYYNALDIKTGGKAVLKAGTYYFGTLNIEPTATLSIEDSKGAAIVYVGDHVIYAGQVAREGGGYPRWMLLYLGHQNVVLDKPFLGTLIAPNARVLLSANTGQYEGAFYGQEVMIHPRVRIVHREVPWVIQSVAFDKDVVCNGETVHMRVDANDPADPAKPALISIDGVPIGDMYDQVMSKPGKHVYAVSAVASDGTQDSMLASLEVIPCASNTPLLPILGASASWFHADTVDFTVLNAKEFEDGMETYEWNFGDGATASGSLASISHDYSESIPLGAQYKRFDVSVMVNRAGATPAITTRTFVVWSTYEMSRARGALEPPTEPGDPILKVDAAGFVGQIEFKNRESELLTYNRHRIDQIPCDPDDFITYGAEAPSAITVQGHGSAKETISISRASVSAKTCALTIHYWGQTSAGRRAQVGVHFELPSKPGSGASADDSMNALLNYVVKNKLVKSPVRVNEEELVSLYRQRKLRYSAATQTFYQSQPPESQEPCDPEEPGQPPEPGFSCQPTGRWEGAGDPSNALQAHIQNALKGDTILVRGCTGIVAPLLGSLNPPQRYTHSGIMTKHKFEIAQATGEEEYLIAKHPNGVLGQPTDAFDEYWLRFLWPGTLVSTVGEAFGYGRTVETPEGQEWEIKGFTNSKVRCSGDAAIVYPRVLKPSPELEESTRPKLMAAGEAAKNIHGHYRFYSYSQAPDTVVNDPNGPQPFPQPSGLSDLSGPVPTVCSSFVRFSLKTVGFELDSDKSFPQPSDVRNGPPDGLFFYDVDERKNAGNVLYSRVYNRVESELAKLQSEADDFWWVGVAAAPIVGWPLGVLGAVAIADLGPVAKFATDAADDVANQVTNCFAFDYCSVEAKDSDKWKEPGNGFAISPDNILDHFDSPTTGGPYGYSEKMIYRGLDFRAVYAWQTTPGSLALSVLVTMVDKAPVPFAQVTIPGFLNTPRQTDGNGRVRILGVPRGNIMIHAQKLLGDPSTGELYEGDSCYIPRDINNLNSQELLHVDCKDFGNVLDQNSVTEATVVLNPPREAFREVTLSGSLEMEDCDCYNSDDYVRRQFVKTCRVNPIQREADVSVKQEELCDDEIGVKFQAHCTLLEDDRTVHITGKVELYEANSQTCGGDDLEDSKTFTQDVAADNSVRVRVRELVNQDVCPTPIGIPYDCSDKVSFQADSFYVTNSRAD